MRTIKIASRTPQQGIILIGESYRNLGKYLPKDTQIIVITDEIVLEHYGEFIREYPHIAIGCGEENKAWSTMQYVIEKMLRMGADRKTFLVGIGGGLVTDITGFVASIFMRGISFGFVATSLLAQVDASLGGKNGVNFQQYKNMLGVFNIPKFVVCDPTMLRTLPEGEVRSGFGEILKHALVKDKKMYNYLDANADALLALDEEALTYVIHRSIRIKAEIVSKDPTEKGLRKTLNFGHTLGHAVENNSGLKHGEAVAVGMEWAAKISVAKGFLKEEDKMKVTKLIEKFKLPSCYAVPQNTIFNFIKKDKKKSGDKISFVYLKAVGKAHVEDIALDELFELISKKEG